MRERLNRIPAAFADILATGELQWVDSVTFVSDVPGKNDGSQGLGGGGVTLDALLDLVQHAQTSIAIQTPYLIMTELGQ